MVDRLRAKSPNEDRRKGIQVMYHPVVQICRKALAENVDYVSVAKLSHRLEELHVLV